MNERTDHVARRAVALGTHCARRVAVLVAAAGLLRVAPAASQQPHRGPDLSSYAAIDAALAGRTLLAADATWRYFPGTADPSPGIEWTRADFDDSGWGEGRAPFGSTDGPGVGTSVDGFGSGLTTLYLRRRFEVPEREAYERILLEIPMDDGYVFYLNGNEEDRLHAHKPDEVLAFDAFASSARDLDTPPVPRFDLTKALTRGSNQLALQGLVHTDDAQSFAIHTAIRGVYRVTPEGERARLEALLPRVEAGGPAGGVAYLMGRHWQRLGDPAKALPHLRAAAGQDPERPEPWARLAECQRALGGLEELEVEMRARLDEGLQTPAMLERWARILLEDLGRTPLELAGLVPADAALPEAGFFADALWAGRELGAGRALRVDCGALEDQERDGVVWSRDRCFTTGRAAQGVRDREDGLDGALRVCARSLDHLSAVYRVPLPSGLYEVRLAFAGRDVPERAAGEAAFDVVLEGARAARATDGLHELRFPVEVADGFLDLDLWPRTAVDPWIAGFEVRPIAPERCGELAAEQVAATARRSAFPLAQLAAARFAAQHWRAAFELLEEAEALSDFQPRDRARLAWLRDALLPQLPSFATADDLARRRLAEAEAILAAVAAGPDADSELALYLAGRFHQEAGRTEEAIAAFEELVAGGTRAPEPWRRLVECLAQIGLGPEAEGLLREGLEGGVPLTDELLQLWISLHVGALEGDPWELVAELAERYPSELPEELAVLPTSEEAPQTWRYTELEPPANVWSRAMFDDGAWEGPGPGGLGAGHVPAGSSRSSWNTDQVYARRTFELALSGLLYPLAKVYANDAAQVYLNGPRACFVGVETNGYVLMPVRTASFVPGENVLGLLGVNLRDSGGVDVGVVQPLGELLWVHATLRETGAVRLNCGGGELTAADGTVWGRDRFYGWAHPSGVLEGLALEIQGTEEDELYRTHRWFYEDQDYSWYQVPLPDGRYRVTLHFAEVDLDLAQPGARVFDVKLQGEPVLERLDVAAAAGFATPLARSFEVEVTEGWLDLVLEDEEHKGFVSALEIERAD